MWSFEDASLPFLPFCFSQPPEETKPTSGDDMNQVGARSRRSAARARDSQVALTFGDSEFLRRFAGRAALPTITVYDTGPFRILEIGAPGAVPSATEVQWDEAKQRLSVGVWGGRRPLPERPLTWPLPELSWFRTFHLPEHQGHLAQARVMRGKIVVQIPSKAADASWSEHLAPLAEARSPELGAKVIPFPSRKGSKGKPAVSTPGDGSASGLAASVRWLGVALGLMLGLPLMLFSLFLFGFLLVPLLPFIGVSLALWRGGGPSAPPARPRLPSAAAAPPPAAQAQAA